ncbi:hypothetical protein P3339_10105 [Microbulbifer sp. MLAF003]|uniref:hypothetical protein n=1 Tax=unclassified Microbulbifer TaxID=2619833 RepID=UPI0024AD6A40|nr:hypothetical protein [Microbulbifer sp. MLAF003]WHI53081.1 hypothetical protein P3339_10105 [Microbulbifer sp. MLAF003]
MNTLPLENANNGYNVAISATFDYNGDKIPVTSQDLNKITDGIKFSLSNPVTLGTINDFLNWLDDKLSTGLNEEALQGLISSIPNVSPLDKIKAGLGIIFQADITIRSLSVDTKSHDYSIGVTATPETPIEIVSSLSLDSIGVEISSTGDEPPEEEHING